jgi:hypothetical protein
MKVISLRPVPLPETENVPSPMRGYYSWWDEDVVPDQTMYEAYRRYRWVDLEPEQDRYNFELVEKDIARAVAQGRRFGFNFQSMRGYRDEKVYVPEYLDECGWWADEDNDGKEDTFIPDWNNSCYLDRVERLVQAFGRRYNADSRIAWIDIGLYGQYGEWAFRDSIDYKQAPEGIKPVTLTSQKRIIDAYLAAFPDTQLLMHFSRSRKAAIEYAFEHPAAKVPIGFRINCVGGPTYFDQWLDHPDDWAKFKERWKIAPLISEFCFIAPTKPYPPTQNLPNPASAIKQVKQFHISLLGNGNIRPWSKFSDQEQKDFKHLAQLLGYRILLNQVNLSTPIRSGRPLWVEWSWSNPGVAPAYGPWQVELRLRQQASGLVLWQGISEFKLAGLLPTREGEGDDDKPVFHADRFDLPPELPAGLYAVEVKITDPDGANPPLVLAIEGRQPDNSFYLGEVTVDENVTLFGLEALFR